MTFSYPDFLYFMLLAIIQGITEFLPVSSSGHLVLLPKFINRNDQGLSIDVAAHVGTLVAVMIYVRSDLIKMTITLKNKALNTFKTGAYTPIDEQSLKLCKLLIIATIPVIIAGFLISLFEPDILRLIQTVAISNIIFAAFLWHSDRTISSKYSMARMSLKEAIVIGILQILAFIPGTSRSGITMTAGRYLGFERTVAARFSLLLSIPVILGAGFLQSLKLIQQENYTIGSSAIFVAVISCIVALIAIHGMMLWLKRANFGIFVLYRISLGVLILAISL